MGSSLRADLEAVRGDNARPLTVAMNGLSDGEGTAMFALFFALSIDALVFLCAFIGVNLGISERVRAVDLILARLRAPGRNDGKVERLLTMPSDSVERELAQDAIRELIAFGCAEYRDDDQNEVLLYPGATEALKAIRNHDSAKQVASEISAAKVNRPGFPGE